MRKPLAVLCASFLVAVSGTSGAGLRCLQLLPQPDNSVNGDFKGTSPVTFAVPSDQALEIRIEKDGYQAADVQNLPTERSGYGIWDVVGGIIPLIVDRS